MRAALCAPALALYVLGQPLVAARAAEPSGETVEDSGGSFRPRVTLSAGGAILGTNTQPYVGDTHEIQKALGAKTTRSTGVRLVPVLTQALWFDESQPGEWRYGVELTERWWSVWTGGESPSAPSANYRIHRSVFAVDAAFVASYRPTHGSLRWVLGGGPMVNRVALEERGWLGDSESVDYVLGGRLQGGQRFGHGPLTFALDASIEWFQLRQRNALIGDGGGVIAGSLGARLELAL